MERRRPDGIGAHGTKLRIGIAGCRTRLSRNWVMCVKKGLATSCVTRPWWVKSIAYVLQ